MIDEIGIVEQLNQRLGTNSRKKVSTGDVVKAMLLNGLGFVSAPMYLFEQFFQGKATEQLLGFGIKSKHLNDDRLGDVLDELYDAGLSELFLEISLQAAPERSSFLRLQCISQITQTPCRFGNDYVFESAGLQLRSTSTATGFGSKGANNS